MGKGGITGKINNPNFAGASGIWSLREQQNAVKDYNWPWARYGYIGTSLSLSVFSSHSHTDVNFGPADGLLVIFVLTPSNVTISSITAAGVALTAGHSAHASNASGRVGIYFGRPAATSGTVAITFSGSATGSTIEVFRLDSTTSTVLDGAANAGTSATSLALTNLSNNVSTGGCHFFTHSMHSNLNPITYLLSSMTLLPVKETFNEGALSRGVYTFWGRGTNSTDVGSFTHSWSGAVDGVAVAAVFNQ